MKSKERSSIKIKLIPYILFPIMIGILTGILIFLFKISVSSIIHWSEGIYAFVQQNPKYFPLLIVGAAVLGSISAVILSFAKECRGGGIPTAVASIRGLIPMKWIQSIFALYFSALITFFVGVPLGNEGPSVQMGAAVGKGNSRLLKKNRLAWERYFMTGGACAGFAIVTGAPLSGIMFALEEAHRRFSVTLFSVASFSVLFGTVTYRYLAFFFHTDVNFLDLTISEILPMKYLWAAILVGVMCGICSLLLTKSYRIIKKFSKTKTRKFSLILRFTLIFTVTAVLGFFSAHLIGTGHALIEDILHGKVVWYALLLIFCIRALVMVYANHRGVSGGVFVPTLTFGAMVASLVSDALIALNLIDARYYVILIVIGMVSFLSASSRTPITAIAFAFEALCGAGNIIPVIFGVVISYIIAEISGDESFADTVIEARTEAAHDGKTAIIVDEHWRVRKGSFIDGKEIRDVLWPPTCQVLSIDRKRSRVFHRSLYEIQEGDLIHLHYQTYNPDEMKEMLTSIFGKQPEDKHARTHLGNDDHIVPSD
jgi:H+/Cl- antiporter ClcA